MSPLLNRKVRENYTCLIRRRVNLCHCARTNVRFRLFCAINHRCHRISLISVLGVWFWLWIAFEEVHTTTLLPLLVKESMEKLFLSKVQTYDYTIPMKCSLILNYACLLSFAWKESCDGMNYVLCIFLELDLPLVTRQRRITQHITYDKSNLNPFFYFRVIVEEHS